MFRDIPLPPSLSTSSPTMQSPREWFRQMEASSPTALLTTTLFLGDLSVVCTETSLRELFSKYGELERVQLKKSDRDPQRAHLGFGFVKFTTRASAERALEELNGKFFLGRALRVGWADDHNRIAAVKASDPKKNHQTAQLHVSFTSRDPNKIVSEMDLGGVFNSFGNVVDIAIKKNVFNKELGIQSGYAFIHFALTLSGLQSALTASEKVNNCTFDEITYKCKTDQALIMQYMSLKSSEPSSPHHDYSRTPSPMIHDYSRAPSPLTHDYGRAPSPVIHDYGRAPSPIVHDYGRAPSPVIHDYGRAPSPIIHDYGRAPSPRLHDYGRIPSPAFSLDYVHGSSSVSHDQMCSYSSDQMHAPLPALRPDISDSREPFTCRESGMKSGNSKPIPIPYPLTFSTYEKTQESPRMNTFLEHKGENLSSPVRNIFKSVGTPPIHPKSSAFPFPSVSRSVSSSLKENDYQSLVLHPPPLSISASFSYDESPSSYRRGEGTGIMMMKDCYYHQE